TGGVLLDGSIESTIIAALASRHQPNLKTFSIGTDEQSNAAILRHTRLVADRYKTDHTEYRVTTQDMFASLPGMLKSLSEPFAEPSFLAQYMLSEHVSQHVSFALTGSGA